MPSLAHCLDLHNVGTIESARLTLAAKTYVAKGFTVKEADQKAVNMAIKALEGERADVVAQIKEQVPGYGEIKDQPETGPDYENIWNNLTKKEQAKMATSHRRELNAKEKRTLGKEVQKKWNELPGDTQESLKKWIGRQEFEKGEGTDFEPGLAEKELETAAPSSRSPEIILEEKGLEVTKHDDGYHITGNTFEHKDNIKAAGDKILGWAKFDSSRKSWRFKNHASINKLANLFIGRKDFDEIPESGRPGDEPVGAEARPDGSTQTTRSKEDNQKYISEETSRLIDKGVASGIPQKILDEQKEDIASINLAFSQGKKMYLLANEAGTGKTFVLGGALREIQRKTGIDKILYITVNQSLIQQIKKDLAEYGITDKVEFITYNAFRDYKASSKDVVVFDENQNIKNASTKQGIAAKNLIPKSKFTIFASATPFENPVEAGYLNPTGIFREEGGFYAWAKKHGADSKTVRGKMGDIEILVWSDKNIEGNKKAHNWFKQRGIYTQREMQIPKEMTNVSFKKVSVDSKWSNLYEKVTTALERAQSSADNQMKFMLGGQKTALQKRILEASKISAAIDLAQEKLDKNRSIVIFVETKAPKTVDYLEILDNTGKHSKVVVEMAQALAGAGIEKITIDSAEALIKKRLGKENVAIYTGSISDAAAQKNLLAWRNGEKKVLVVTMDKGGTGLSLHDTVGDRPTDQINVNLPWKATKVAQVSGRVARYGIKSKAAIEWLFTEDIPFDRQLAQKVGQRMQTMGAFTSGTESMKGEQIESFTLDDSVVKDEKTGERQEEIEVKIEGKDKDVSVDLTAKEEAKVTPKEQKEYLLAEIDKAIKMAKDAPKIKMQPRLSDGETWKYRSGEETRKTVKKEEERKADNREIRKQREKQYGTVTIHVPGDGIFTVLNTKQTLQAFHKKAKRFFTTSKPKGITKISEKKAPLREAKLMALTEIKGVKGWFTDGTIVVKGKPPANAQKNDQRVVDFKEPKKTLDAKTEPAELKYFAVSNKDAQVHGVTKEELPPSMTGEGYLPLVMFQRKSSHVLEGSQDYSYGNEVWLDALRLNIVRKRYPNATYGLTENDILIAYDKDKPIAALGGMANLENLYVIREMAEKKGFVEKKYERKTKKEEISISGAERGVDYPRKKAEDKDKTIYPEVISEKTGSYKSGVEIINNAGEAAAFAHENLSKYAQEHLVVLILDKNNKILAGHRHSIGTPQSTQVSPAVLAGHVLNTPDANSIIIVHNHPAGSASLSDEDKYVFNRIENILKGTSVRARDILAVGGDEFESYKEYKGGGLLEKIPDIKARFDIPMVERIFLTKGEKLHAVQATSDVIIFGKQHLPGGGLLILDGQNCIIATVKIKSYKNLRGKNSENILKQIDATNGTSLIAYEPNREISLHGITNLQKFANATNLSLIDGVSQTGSWLAAFGTMPDTKETVFYSKAKQKTASKSTPTQVKTYLAKTLGKKRTNTLIKSGRVKVVEAEADLPGGSVSSSKDDTILGAYAGDTVYLVSENLTEQNTHPTLLHEAMHAELDQNGWEGLFGKRHAQIKAQFERMLEDGHAGLLAAKKQAEEVGTSEEHMFEETLAAFISAKTNHKTSLFKRILKAIRAWAIRNGLTSKVTPDDLVTLAEAAVRRQAGVVSEGRVAGINEFAQNVGAKLSQAKKKITDNSNFVKWFGDSKVVDESGEPLIVYHGTSEKFYVFSLFGPNFFTADKEYARGYAGKKGGKEIFVTAYLSIQKPFNTQNEKTRKIYNEQFIPYAKKNYYDDGRYTKLEKGETVPFTTADNLWAFLRGAQRKNQLDYDGIAVDEGIEGKNISYVPLVNTQIKSIYNTEFSQTDPDIRYSKAPKPKSYQVALEKYQQRQAAPLVEDLIKKTKSNFDSVTADSVEDLIKKIESKIDSVTADPGTIKALVKSVRKLPKRFRSEVVTTRDLEWYHKVFETPYVLAKKFTSMKNAMATEIKRQESRTKKIFRYYHSDLSDLQKHMQKNPEDLKAYEDLLWKWEGRRMPKEKVPTNWYSIDKETNQLTINPEHYTEVRGYLRKQGVKDVVADGFVTVRKILDNVLVEADSVMRSDNVDQTDLQEFRSYIGKTHNYFSHVREGNSYILVIDAETKKTVYREHFDKKRERLLPENKMAKARAEAWVKSQPRDKKKYIITKARNTKQFPDEVLFQLPVEALDQIASEAGRGLRESRVKVEAERLMKLEGLTKEEAYNKARKKLTANIERALAKAMADVIKTRGWGKHSIQRQNIPGFKKTDTFETLSGYLIGYSGFVTKIQAAKEHSKTLRNMDAKKTPKEYKFTSNYIKDVLSNADKIDQFVDKARALIFIKYLGFIPKSGLVNLTQNVVMAGPILSQYTKQSHRKLAKAMSDVKKSITGKDAWMSEETKYTNLPRDEQKALAELVETGVAQDLFLRDLKGGYSSKGWGKYIKIFMDKSGIFMQVAEKFNRASTGLAAYRIAMADNVDGKQTKGNYDLSVEFAKKIIYDSHFLYGMLNTPAAFRGGDVRKMARSAYTFRTFTHSYLDIMLDLMVNQGLQGFKVAGRSMMNLIIIGGLASVPFKCLFEVIKWVFGDEDEDTLTEIRSKMPNKFMQDLVTYGLIGAVGGSDISGSLSIEVPTKFKELIGVPYAFYEDSMNMKESIKAGNTYRAVAETPITPMFVRNAMRGIELYTKGQRTRGGRAINVPGQKEPKKISGIKAIKKGVFGLQDVDISSGYKAYRAAGKMRRAIQKKKRSWADKIANATIRKDFTEVRAINREIDKWNRDAKRDNKPWRVIDIEAMVESRLSPSELRGIPKSMRRKTKELYGAWN